MKLFSIVFLIAIIGSLALVEACTIAGRDCFTPSGCGLKKPGNCCFTNGNYRCCYPDKIGPDNYCYA